MRRSLLALCLVAAIVPAARGEDRSFELAVARESESTQFSAPRVLRVEQGDRVVLRVVSDSVGEVHLHGYRLEARVAPGRLTELAFAARATGRFRVEWHASGEARDSEHRAAPIAILEVHPK